MEKPEEIVIRPPLCIVCGKEFAPKIPYQLCCSEDCSHLDNKRIEEAEKNYWTTCTMCALGFRKTHIASKQEICDVCKKSKSRRQYDKRSKAKNLNGPKKRGRYFDPEELNKQAEKKRKFDESFAERFIRGKTFRGV